MAHVSGNATWADYPSTATLVTAARLEAIENTSDALYTSEYGSLTRTKRPIFRCRITGGGYAQAAGTDMLWSGFSMTVDSDVDAGWVPGTPGYYQIPISGRVWDIYFHLSTAILAAGVPAAGHILVNGSSVAANSMAGDLRIGTGGEAHVQCHRLAVPLTAGDRLYFASWSSGTPTWAVSFGGVYPEVVVRDAGPQ